MIYHHLGNTGITVSKLCFGALTVGPLQAGLSPEAAGEVLAFGFHMGINFVDMAELYGVYPHVREGLRRAKSGDSAVLCSKTYAFKRQAALDAVDAARRSLDRDVIDIFMLHEQESEHTLRGHRDALDGLYGLKAQGVLRAVGISTHYVAGVRAATELGVDVIHPLLNVAGWGIVDGSRREMEDACAAACCRGIGIYAMKVFGGGNLHRRSAECLSYALSLAFADSIAIGMQSMDEVRANLSFFENGCYTAKEEEVLLRRDRRLHVEDWCTGCGNCTRHCPQGALYVADGYLNVKREKP